MCGLAGIYHRDGKPVEVDTLTRMTRLLAHRGPDDEGFWIDGSVGFGHRRLSIRDLSRDGRQPMTSPDGNVVLSYNGEIYNDDKLRRILEREIGWRFRSRTDTEVVLAGWLAWGEALVEKLDGMFAFAIWDARTRMLVLARDPVGIKPLFLAETPGAVAFASEIKGLMPALDRSPSWTPEALHTFLAQGYVGPASTLFGDVSQVAPGTILSFTGAVRQERRYWEPRRTPEISSLPEAVGTFLATWKQTVTSMTVSDVAVGVLQSGGIDSSLITFALASKNLPVFTASFGDDTHDEIPLAQQVAKAANVPMHEIAVETVSSPETTFRAMVRAFDGQVADSSAYALYLLCGAVRRRVTVALAGDGGDEFFAGYETYRASRLARMLAGLVPLPLARATGQMVSSYARPDESRLPPLDKAARFLLGIGMGGEPHSQWRRILPKFLIHELYGDKLRPLAEADPLAAYGAAIRAGGSGDDGMLFADQTHYLPADILAKTDAMSMAHGLEIRVPFLARSILDLAGRIDARVLYPRGGPPKAPLRAALAALGAPDEIVRAPKRGFNLPVDRMLRGPLAKLGRRMLDLEADRLSPWLEPSAIRRLWREHSEHERSWGYLLWLLLTLSVSVEEAQ